MRIYKQYEVKMPVYALSYIINGDSSGLEPHDIEIIDRYMREFEREAQSVNGSMVVDFPSDEQQYPYFTWKPAFGLASDVMDTQITILI